MAVLWSLTEIWPRKDGINLKGVAMLTDINYEKARGKKAQLLFTIRKITSKYFYLNKIILLLFYKNKIVDILTTRSLNWLLVTIKDVHLYLGCYTLLIQIAKNQIAMQIIVYYLI